MTSTNFYIAHTEAGDMIRDVKSMLKISIRRLEEITFEPNAAELQFYSKYQNGHIVFETVNIKDYLRPLVASALHWYAEYIGQPDMYITNEDPRPAPGAKRFPALANISQTVE
ncbi:MAG: hypothetical protein JSU01_10685 [Bacteroidetes bacterium]|nr:hypothetical protein [Bacteroidota bacterium]